MQQTTEKKKDKADLKLNFDTQKKEWRMAKDQGMAEGPGKYAKLEVKKDHEGAFTFKIQNPKDITFAATDPFVPKPGKTNPTDFTDQFTVSAGGTDTLVVTDANANKNGGEYLGGDYIYELRFSDGSTLDPIITNGGCCRTNMQSDMAFLAVGAIALLALVYLVVRPMLARRAAG